MFSQKIEASENFIILFSSEKLAQVFLLEEVRPSRDRKMIKILPQQHLAKP